MVRKTDKQEAYEREEQWNEVVMPSALIRILPPAAIFLESK